MIVNRLYLSAIHSALSRSLVLSALAALGWGIGLSAAHHGISLGLQPLDLAFVRYVVAGPILLLCHSKWKVDHPSRISTTSAILLALLGGPILMISIVGGSRRAPFESGVLVEVATLAVCSIILARLLLGEKLDIWRRLALLALSARLGFLLSPSIAAGHVGLLLFACGGAMSAAVGAVCCRWRTDPIATLTIVTLTSLTILVGYYVSFDSFERLIAAPWSLLLEQGICQGVIAGFASWLGFLYSARTLGLVTASFLPAITPAMAALLMSVLTGEILTVSQLGLVCLGVLSAFLLVLNLSRLAPGE